MLLKPVSLSTNTLMDVSRPHADNGIGKKKKQWTDSVCAVSNRLTGGPANTNCLSTTEAGGMGEGWGDFMATAIRLKSGDTRNTDYSLGAWVYNNKAGIRNYLYSTKLTVNPYMYTTANTYNEVHDIGEIWATMLYEVMWNLIDKHGLSVAQKPTFSGGVPTDGKFLTMKLVIDGMAL